MDAVCHQQEERLVDHRQVNRQTQIPIVIFCTAHNSINALAIECQLFAVGVAACLQVSTVQDWALFLLILHAAFRFPIAIAPANEFVPNIVIQINPRA